MTPPIERRPTLRKAPVSDDVVAGLTSVIGQPVQKPAPESLPQANEIAFRELAPARETAPATLRRGPGRPRGRRRMEPFSSKIEISLRDELDSYAAQYGESYVDLLDRALRAAISQPPPS